MSAENRETIEVVTPIDKCKVLLKSWITGKEKRDLRKPFFESMRFNITEREGANVKDVNSAEIMEKAENLAIETIVVSVNGETEGILDKVLNLKSKDYDFVVAEINKISREENFLV